MLGPPLSLETFRSLLLPRFRVRVFSSDSMASSSVEYRCFVGGLAWATDNHALEKAFSSFGEIVEAKVRLSSSRSGFVPIRL